MSHPQLPTTAADNHLPEQRSGLSELATEAEKQADRVWRLGQVGAEVNTGVIQQELLNLGHLMEKHPPHADAVTPLAQAHGYLGNNRHATESETLIVKHRLMSLRRDDISAAGAASIASAWGNIGDNRHTDTEALRPAGKEIQALWQHAKSGDASLTDSDLRKFGYAASSISKHPNIPPKSLGFLGEMLHDFGQYEKLPERAKNYVLSACANLSRRPETPEATLPLISETLQRLEPNRTEKADSIARADAELARGYAGLAGHGKSSATIVNNLGEGIVRIRNRRADSSKDAKPTLEVSDAQHTAFHLAQAYDNITNNDKASEHLLHIVQDEIPHLSKQDHLTEETKKFLAGTQKKIHGRLRTRPASPESKTTEKSNSSLAR